MKKTWTGRIFKFLFGLLILFFFISAIFYYGSDKLSAVPGDSIVVIDLENVIYESESLIKRFDKYINDDSVKGFILRINSPGGGVAPSQEIFRYLRKLQKPVYASMSSLAASGGYYSAVGCQKIFALPGTITGSIGVIIKFPNFKSLYDKIGIDFKTIKSGKFKDIGSPDRPMSEEETKLLQDSIMDVYEQFITDILSARKIDEKLLRQYADGRILTGNFAQKIGFVDSLGSYMDAFEDMKKTFNFSEAKIHVDRAEKPFWEKIAENYSHVKNFLMWDSGFYYLYEGF